MTKKKSPVRYTGQHFTIDKMLIKDAIKQANITQQDTVLDIGAGKGFITLQLLQNAQKVIAIENDSDLIQHLRERFRNAQNVQIVECDFQDFKIPKYPFRVTSNIPYGITSKIFKNLMFGNLENFLGGSIILQLEAVQKLFSNKTYNPLRVVYHTFYDLELQYAISPKSFSPPPTVNSALLRIERKDCSLAPELKIKYLNFISHFLKKPNLPTRTALKSVFRKRQVRIISIKFGINLNSPIVCLRASEWQNCFLEMLEVVPKEFHPKKPYR